jgi:hypothetical protein
MDGQSDRSSFLRVADVRVEVAAACLARPATRSEIAKKLGREPGSLSVIDTLSKAGVLHEKPPREGGDKRAIGARWELDPHWIEATKEAMAELKVGILGPEIDLVLIAVQDVLRSCEVFLGDPESIAWISPLRGEQMGLLVCPAAEPDERRTLRLIDRLAQAGVSPIRLHLPSLLARNDAIGWARRSVGDEQGSALIGHLDQARSTGEG